MSAPTRLGVSAGKYDVGVTGVAADWTPEDTARLYVLDPAHDREALYALMRYAELCINHGKFDLGNELFDKIGELQERQTYQSEGGGRA